MITIYGRRYYGAIDDVDGVHVATLFRHIWWIPILPVRSYLVGAPFGHVAVGLVFRSVLATYLRFWCPIVLVWTLLLFSAESYLPFREQHWLMALLCIVGSVYGWGFIGRVSERTRQQRRVYALHAGGTVDVALLDVDRLPLREKLEATLRERFAHAIDSYRGDPGASPDFVELAATSEVRDEAFLGAALTLARLDSGEAEGEAAKSLSRAHDAIWQKLAAQKSPKALAP